MRRPWVKASLRAADTGLVLTATIVFAVLIAIWGGLIPLHADRGPWDAD